MAASDLLKRFDYISTVSGGGYLGTSLQWWWSRQPRQDPPDPDAVSFGIGPDDFPYASAAPPADNGNCAAATTAAAAHPPTAIVSPARNHAQKNLDFLRAHASYLIAGYGLSAWSMLAVVLRTVVISLLIWIPLLTFCFVFVNWLDVTFLEKAAQGFELWSPLGTVLEPQWAGPCGDFTCDLKFPAIYALILYVFYGLCLLFVSASIFFALLSRAPQEAGGGRMSSRIVAITATIGALIYLWMQYASFDGTVIIVMSAAVIFVGVAVVITVADLTTPPALNTSYWLRRRLESGMGRMFIPALAVLAVATVPILPHYLAANAFGKLGPIGGAIGLLGGIFSALYGYYTFLRNIVPSLVGQIAATIGAVLYLYATLVLAYLLAMVLLHADDVYDEQKSVIRVLLFGSIILAFVIGFVANLNYVGLHRFYRDRLMEAFMPADASVHAMQARYSAVADTLSIGQIKDSSQCDPDNPAFVPRPYPLINANAILINDPDQTVAQRGGDNFVISPLFVGSAATGWQDTEEYIEQNGPLSLASAMAASGAAASASAGYIGTGITMNPLVSAVMSLLNVRLGLWVGNPFHNNQRKIRSIPTFLNPGLVSGILGRAHRRNSGFIELTDGGHFENLALYELVRRKLAVILIVDGEADPNISLRSLVSASHRIEQDFKAVLTFFDRQGPERLLAHPNEDYPAGVRYAQSPFLVGQIDYADGTHGTLIYLKATLIKGLDFPTRGYVATNPDFPHQSTVDQFFRPDQFEAYRHLGQRSASRLIDDLQLTRTIARPAEIIAQYLGTLPRADGRLLEHP